MTRIVWIKILAILLAPALLVIALPDVSHAQSESRQLSKAERTREARRLFYQGQRKYRLAQFRPALALYAKAYDILPLPAFLFNIGQCHRLLGDCKKALFFYQGYLTDSPRAKNRATVVTLIGMCKAKLARQATVTPKRGVEPGPASRLRPRGGTGSTGGGTGSKPYLPGKDGKKSTSIARKWWFWTSIAGVVVIAVATGLGVGLSNRSGGASLPASSLGSLNLR